MDVSNRLQEKFFAAPNNRFEKAMLKSSRQKLRAITNNLTGHCLRLQLQRTGLPEMLRSGRRKREAFFDKCPTIVVGTEF